MELEAKQAGNRAKGGVGNDNGSGNGGNSTGIGNRSIHISITTLIIYSCEFSV